MEIIKQDEKKTYFLSTKKVDESSLRVLSSALSQQIINLLKYESLYPKQIAKRLNIHEQNIYYHIRNLERAGVIRIKESVNINGTQANVYQLASESFFYQVDDFREKSKNSISTPKYLEPFIKNGELDAIVIVGSPDPHGPFKARSRDGYFGMDLALFLGSYTHVNRESRVRLDTDIREEDLSKNNLIVLGGPIVNKVSDYIGSNVPVYFDSDRKGLYSSVTGKTYLSEECGCINNCSNPFNSQKRLLQIIGLRNSGTKAAIVAFLKHFDELQAGNKNDSWVLSSVVEGVDFDADGVVDDCEFFE